MCANWLDVSHSQPTVPLYINGQFIESKTSEFIDLLDPVRDFTSFWRCHALRKLISVVSLLVCLPCGLCGLFLTSSLVISGSLLHLYLR